MKKLITLTVLVVSVLAGSTAMAGYGHGHGGYGHGGWHGGHGGHGITFGKRYVCVAKNVRFGGRFKGVARNRNFAARKALRKCAFNTRAGQRLCRVVYCKKKRFIGW